ncbi:MAG: hypothetical protein AAFN41_12765, partial [Planctomycetota bacterium]
LTTPPSPIVQVWSNTQFGLAGDGSPITVATWNPAYNSSLGEPSVPNNGTGQIEFYGSSNIFFNMPDPSNPLWVADFHYGGTIAALDLSLIGLNAATFELPPFSDVRLYQDDAGNPGELTFRIDIVPSPATLALAPCALVAVRRRR